jgi:hypothetical protein
MAFEGNFKSAVKRALEELERALPDSRVTAQEDGEGGANVTIEQIVLGLPYEQDHTWVGFRIGFQYPASDVYPHFVRPDLKRLDGKSLGDGMSTSSFLGRPAIQVSRRSNNLNSTVQNAVLKLLKVVQWLKSR